MKWTEESVTAELVQLFGQHAQPGSPVSPGSHLVADLGIDSLGVMEIMGAIEERFALKIPDDALRDLETVADVAAAIQTRLRSAGRLEG
jgi:acyl carrier protein